MRLIVIPCSRAFYSINANYYSGANATSFVILIDLSGVVILVLANRYLYLACNPVVKTKMTMLTMFNQAFSSGLLEPGYPITVYI